MWHRLHNLVPQHSSKSLEVVLFEQPQEGLFVPTCQWGLESVPHVRRCINLWVVGKGLRQQPLKKKKKTKKGNYYNSTNPEPLHFMEFSPTCRILVETSSWLVSSRMSSKLKGWSSPSW